MSALASAFAVEQLLAEVRAVRTEQDSEDLTSYPDGTGPETMPLIFLEPVATAPVNAERASEWIRVAGEEGGATSRDLLLAEVLTAFSFDDPALLHRALVRVAATALRWTEHVDLRARTERAAAGPAHVKSAAERRRAR